MESREKRFRILPIFQLVGMIVPLVLIVLFPLVSGKGITGERITIGEVEDVVLMPWGVRLPARIDTGASRSSLDARELKVKDNMVEFKLPKKYGSLPLCLPVIDWLDIRSADFKEKRPVVEITFCLGPKLIKAQVTLNDRSSVRYPLIIGRNVLKDNFVVDCMQSNCLPPSCPEVPSK
jgi:hypothetical protein